MKSSQPFIETLRQEFIKHKTYQTIKKLVSKETNGPYLFGEILENKDKLNTKNLKKDLISFLKKFSPEVYKYLDTMSSIEKTLQIEVYLKLLSIVLSYERCGRITFKVRKLFTQLLANTDFPEEVKLERVAFPYNGFFLEIEDSFLQTEDGPVNEGLIYVSLKEEDNNILLSIDFIEEVKDSYIVPWNISITASRDKTILDLFKKLVEEDYKKQIESRRLGDEIGLFKKDEISEMVLKETHQKIEENMRIFINLLLYINHINEDVIDISPVPKSLKEKIAFYESKNDTKRLEKVKKQLLNYSRVYLIGNNTAQSVEKEIKNTGDGKRPHWRRGHIRYYDPQKPRKIKYKKTWTFVRPTLVGVKKDKREGEKRGEIERKEYIF